jgi:transposase
MGKQIRADYEQILMFPPLVEDWVGKDHPARFIRDFVDSLDLRGLEIDIPDADTGRPPYAADLMLKVWLFGYFNRIRSSRALEKGCRENMGLIWLTGMNAPDHNSISRFFRANKNSLGHLFKQSIRVALKADLIGLALHAVDGTKIQYVSFNDKDRGRERLEISLEAFFPEAGAFLSSLCDSPQCPGLRSFQETRTTSHGYHDSHQSS